MKFLKKITKATTSQRISRKIETKRQALLSIEAQCRYQSPNAFY